MRFVRVVAGPFPRAYSILKNVHHQLTFLRERAYLRQNRPGTLSIRYSQKTLKELRQKGFCSQYGQDFFLLEHRIIPQEHGSFIDVGGNDPIDTSNSYFLEKVRGYKGIAIEALDNYENIWAQERPATIFVNSFVSDEDDGIDFATVSGHQGWENKLSGAVKDIKLSGKNVNIRVSKAQPKKLRDILEENHMGFGADVLFIDVEGHEKSVLASSNWSLEKPSVIVIENNGTLKTQEEIRSYICKKGYRFYARIFIFDDVFILG